MIYFIFGLLLLTTISYSQEIASENSIRIRRSSAYVRPGQVIQLDPNDKNVVKMAISSIRKYADDIGLKYELFIVTVLEATGQLTTGIIYKLHFYAKPIIYCDPKHASKCNKRKSLYILNCQSRIHSRPWLFKPDDIRVNCKKEYPIGKN